MNKLAKLTIFAFLIFTSFATAQVQSQQQAHYLDVPGALPAIPEVDPPGGGGILEEPEADSIVFVVDRSCSMGWGSSSIEIPGIPHATPWQAAQYELARAVDNLDGEAEFCVVLFNHSFITWRSELQVASEGNKASAISWVNSQYATGGTTYVSPVNWAINIVGGGPPEVVMFLSDGAPNEGYSAVAAITAANGGKAVINTVAFGVAGAALQIMQDIAAQNGGECRAIP